MLNIRAKKTLLLPIFLFLGIVLQGFAFDVSDGNIVRGCWNSRYADSKAYADQKHVPMLLFWGNPGCDYCDKLAGACEQSDFTAWQADRRLVMVYIEGTGTPDAKAAKIFAQNDTKSYPYICLYWPQKSGALLVRRFPGRSRKMPISSGSLQRQLMDSVDSLLNGYSPDDYCGGIFLVPGTKKARLEAEAGVTTQINVPLVRTLEAAAVAATNSLEITYPGEVRSTNRIEWAFGVTNAKTIVTVPENVVAGNEIRLTLLRENGNVVASSVIPVLAPQTNSCTNPFWLGERNEDSLRYGEWTMDLEMAKRKVAGASGNAYTLVRFTGELWCPYCIGSAKTLLVDPAFTEWAEENQVALVTMDNPRLGLPGPTLLRHEVSEKDNASGSGYLSRKMIDEDAAEEVAQRNLVLGSTVYKLPSSTAFRVGNPTFILLRKDGTICGRFAASRSATSIEFNGESVFFYPTEENIGRLNDLLLLAAEGREEEKSAYTTPLTYAVGARTNVTLQVNDTEKVYRLQNLAAGRRVHFSTDSEKVSLAVLQSLDPTNFTTTVIGTAGSGKALQVDVTEEMAAGSLFLLVKAYADGVSATNGSTRFSATLTSSCILLPREACAEYIPERETVRMELKEGTLYRLTGFGDLSSCFAVSNAVEGLYFATADGVKDLPVASVGESVYYQVWKPGRISFVVGSQRIIESGGIGMISVKREEGSSGAVTVRVVLDASRSVATNGIRYVWTDGELTWADGESGSKGVSFLLHDNQVFEPEQVFCVTLETEDGPAEVDAGAVHTVGIFDTTDPYFESEAMTFSCYATLPLKTSVVVYNITENKNVSLKKVSGKLPTGVKAKYSKEEQCVVLSGSPSVPGVYSAVYTVTERRAGETAKSRATSFIFQVAHPKKVNVYAGETKKITIPLLRQTDAGITVEGLVNLSLNNRNRLLAKVTGIGKAVSLSGQWQGFDAEGSLISVLTKKNSPASLRLSLSTNGQFSVAFDANESGIETGSFEGIDWPREERIATYAGYYTVTLPFKEFLRGGEENLGTTGTGYLTLTCKSSTSLRTGKVYYKGILPTGKNFSGSSYLLPLDEEHAILPIFSRNSKDAVGLILSMKANAAENPMAVLKQEGTVAYWEHTESAGSYACAYDVYGSFYNPGVALGALTKEYYSTTTFRTTLAGDEVVSPVYGALIEIPSVEVGVGDSKMTVLTKQKNLSFRFNKHTGIFFGTAKLGFSNGKTVSAKYRGVLLPGWSDCGCTDESALDRPFGSGAVWFSDAGWSRGFPVDLTAVSDE